MFEDSDNHYSLFRLSYAITNEAVSGSIPE